MQVESTPSVVREIVRTARRDRAVVGVVPTMGALHAGHVSLIERARTECDFVVATIFVNPTQFGPNEDFSKYPRTMEQDLEMCKNADADLVFTPDTSQMYTADAETVVKVTQLTSRLEGAVRPTHFDGVTTVVAKLFNITDPDKAFFGQKDFQQQLVIRRMVADLDWGIEIVTCPIVREADGLAMSSRNRYLSAEERQRSLVLSQSLQLGKKLALETAATPAEIERQMQDLILATDGVVLDYAVVLSADSLLPLQNRPDSAVALVAARLGATRLIDNQILQFR
ncbi:MAG: pantoate--beta-alanine ligase [Fuerstiella sp.]